jgi:hypothetical protein
MIRHPDNCPCEGLGIAQAVACPPTDIPGILAYLDQRISATRRLWINSADGEEAQSSGAQAMRIAMANHAGTLDALVQVRDWVATGQAYALALTAPPVAVGALAMGESWVMPECSHGRHGDVDLDIE